MIHNIQKALKVSEPFAIFEVTKQSKMNTNLNNPTENWLPVPNYEKLYSVSDLGNIKALEITKRRGRYFQNCPEKYLKQKHEKRGYMHVTLCKDSERKTVGVHQIVAKAFIDNPDNKPTVNHKDGNKANNRKDNLEWATHKEQINHADNSGLRNICGTSHTLSKLTEEQVIEIRSVKQLSQALVNDLCARFGIYRTTFYKIRSRKTWKHI